MPWESRSKDEEGLEKREEKREAGGGKWEKKEEKVGGKKGVEGGSNKYLTVHLRSQVMTLLLCGLYVKQINICSVVSWLLPTRF